MIELTIFMILLAGLLASVLATRLTEKPIRIPFNLTQGAANTFATGAVNVPSVPSIAIRRGETTGIGLEVMSTHVDQPVPDNESGQSNQIISTLRKGATPGSVGSYNDSQVIDRWHMVSNNLATTAASETVQVVDTIVDHDLSDGDGNGELVFDDELHISMLGVGNANAKSIEGYMLCHLVEFDQNEAIFELLEATQA